MILLKIFIISGVCITICSTSQSKEKAIINELSWSTRLKIMKEQQKRVPQTRRVGVSFLTAGQEPTDPEPKTEDPTKSEDTSMKVKLFRLMYETLRDSDLKVRRAELIKNNYNNSTIFEIGFLMGDITDKVNIVTDISLTLKKLYAEWRPVEHINAYEQIANKAIEISHLIDVVKIVHRKTPIHTTTTEAIAHE